MKTKKTKFQKIMAEFYGRQTVNYVFTGDLFSKSPIETLSKSINKVKAEPEPKSK